MNAVSRLLKQIPVVRNFIGPDGGLSDGSHKFVMDVVAGDPHATLEDAERAGKLKKLSPAEAATALQGLHQAANGLTIPGGSEMKVHSSSGRVLKVSGIIKRSDLKANPNVTFLFGDNVADHGRPFDQRVGRGGQAAEMAGESNAVGIPTLWKAPDGVDQSAYFSEAQATELAKAHIDKAFAEIKPNQKIVIPVDEKGDVNIGTDRAQLPQRAPSLLSHIRAKVAGLEQPIAGAQPVTNSPTQIPEASVSKPYLTIGEHFSTEIKLPEGVLVSNEPKPQIILESPILGPIDVVKTGLAKIRLSRKIDTNRQGAQDDGWDTITLESNNPVPASIKVGNADIPTQYKFPVKIVNQGQPVAQTTITIGPDKLAAESKGFIDQVCAKLDSGEEFQSLQYPANATRPLITVSNSKTPDQIGGKLLVNFYRPDGTQELSSHFTDRMRGVPGKWGGASFAHDVTGKRQPEDYILGGMAGPEFRSASELARFVLSDKLRKHSEPSLQQAA